MLLKLLKLRPSRTAYLEGVLLAERATRDGSIREVLRDLEADCCPTAFDKGVLDYVEFTNALQS